MSTRCEQERRVPGGGWPAGAGRVGRDATEQVALVARAKRELLLRVHRHQLRREDLEDCFSQATLELVAHAQRGGTFASRLHLENLLELRYVSRIRDLRRALSGRSPMQAALEVAVSLGGVDDEQLTLADPRAELDRLVILREDLRRVQLLARKLSPDQRLVLAWQLGQRSRSDFCELYGWSPEKYRKVGQRARARLRGLMAGEQSRVPPGAVGRNQSTGTDYDYPLPHP